MGKLTYSIFKVIISHFQRSNPIVYANYSLSLFYLLDIFTIVSYVWSFALSVEESASPVLDSDGPFWAHMSQVFRRGNIVALVKVSHAVENGNL